eukprot:13907271-Alexandrium_andersonii.AAC.1
MRAPPAGSSWEDHRWGRTWSRSSVHPAGRRLTWPAQSTQACRQAGARTRRISWRNQIAALAELVRALPPAH